MGWVKIQQFIGGPIIFEEGHPPDFMETRAEENDEGEDFVDRSAIGPRNLPSKWLAKRLTVPHSSFINRWLGVGEKLK